MAMPVRRWRRVPVKHEEIVRSGLYSCSLSLPVIFRRSAPSPMAEINFFIPVCLSKATQDWAGKTSILRLSAASAWRTLGILRFIKIVAINHKRRLGVIISDWATLGNRSWKLERVPQAKGRSRSKWPALAFFPVCPIKSGTFEIFMDIRWSVLK